MPWAHLGWWESRPGWSASTPGWWVSMPGWWASRLGWWESRLGWSASMLQRKHIRHATVSFQMANGTAGVRGTAVAIQDAQQVPGLVGEYLGLVGEYAGLVGE